jgi:hypothetical protein
MAECWIFADSKLGSLQRSSRQRGGGFRIALLKEA